MTPSERDDWCTELHALVAEMNDLFLEHAQAGRAEEALHLIGALSSSIDALGGAAVTVLGVDETRAPEMVTHMTSGADVFVARVKALRYTAYQSPAA